MCTTALLLGTLVMILRRRFSNRVEPYVPGEVLGCWGGGGLDEQRGAEDA
uniref:Uncharacterized protein n=1 Tax=Amazona collaria TaxID=241587 RepID=A0A8B9FC66_9PSIT